MESHEVILYSRSRCGLCDEARKVIGGIAGELGVEFEERLIDGDDALELAFGLRIPVLVVDGREAFEVSVPPGELRRLLAAPRHFENS